MTAPATVFVPGKPVPQGSTKGFVIRGRAVITSDNKATMPWRADVAGHVRQTIGPGILYPIEPVFIQVEFVMPRRAAEPKKITPAHIRKPDTDKLVRAIFDAIRGLIYTDDAQVTNLVAVKRTAALGEQPGAHISWSAL